MAFLSLFLFIYQFNIFQSLLYEDVSCDAAKSSDLCIFHCDATTVIPKFSCGNADQCYFYCQYHQCMENGILSATNSNNLYAYSSHSECFKNTQIYTPNAGNASIAINSIHEKELKLMKVYGGINTESIRINCTGSNKETCKQIQVYAENTKYLQIVGNTPSIMEDAVIHCPINSTYDDAIPCNIDFSAGGIIKDATFNTANGIPKDIMITGTLEGTVTITCSQVNGVSKNNGDSFQNEGDCWITEAPTTEAPTTQHPTTYPPTTQSPTTDIPTIYSSTTDIPTTAIPTTYPPTTQSPTTDIPTTVIPTTYSSIIYPSTTTTSPPTTERPTIDPLSTDTTDIPNEATTRYRETTQSQYNPNNNEIIIAKQSAQSTSTTVNRADNAELTENTQHFKDIGSSSDNINDAASNNSFNFADHMVKLCLLASSVILLAICGCFLYCSMKRYTLNKSKSVETSMQCHQNHENSTKPDNNSNTEHYENCQQETMPKLASNQPSLKFMVSTKSNYSDDVEESVEGIYNDDIYMKDYDIMAGITDAGLDEIVISDEKEESEDSMGLYGHYVSAEIVVIDNHITPCCKLSVVLEEDQEEQVIENEELQINMDGIHNVNMHKRNITYYGTDISIPDTPQKEKINKRTESYYGTDIGDV